jgi:hypothetical protein
MRTPPHPHTRHGFLPTSPLPLTVGVRETKLVFFSPMCQNPYPLVDTGLYNISESGPVSAIGRTEGASLHHWTTDV